MSSHLIRRANKMAAIVAVLVLFSHHSDCLRQPMRSVQVCEQRSRFVSSFQSGQVCKTHCQETYIRVGHAIMRANEKMAQSYLRPLARTADSSRALECCCRFETQWPLFLDPKLIGSDRRKVNRKFTCMPILASFNLSERTKDSYNLVCKYLKKQEPLTMLMLSQFVEAAAYLNFMHPKHPSIRHVLNNKMVARLQEVELNELREALDSLLDAYLPLNEYDGHSLRTRRFRRFLELKKELSHALRSRIVAKAFDELIISHMLVDVAAAAQHLKDVGENRLRLPSELFNGGYDEYDPDLGAYFTLKTVECKLLAETNKKLDTYLSVMRSLSNILDEKLVYEHMSEKSPHLKAVLNAQKVFRNTFKVNCGPNRG